MSAPLQLALYSAAIALATMGGALVPIVLNKERHGALLAFAAGIMLGAAFFQMLPEAFHSGGYPAFALVPVGFLALLLLERFVLVYASEEPPDCAEHGHGGSLGLAAFIGMSVHTLFDGVALASSVAEGIGLTAFVAITAHKVSSSLGLASILRAERRSTAATLGFAAALGGWCRWGRGWRGCWAACCRWRRSPPAPWPSPRAPSSTWPSRTCCRTSTGTATASGGRRQGPCSPGWG